MFQVESAAMVDTLIKLKPTSLEEVIAVLALNRPGPMQFIDSFIKRKKGKEKINFPPMVNINAKNKDRITAVFFKNCAIFLLLVFANQFSIK